MRPCIFILPFAFVAVLTFASGAWAEARRFELKEGGAVTLDVPEGWLAAPGYLGMPLMILGPETTITAEGRPVISVTPTRKKIASLSVLQLEKSQREYQDGRKAWLTKSQGQLIDFKPLRKERLEKGAQADFLGYRYRIGTRDFEEFTYFVVCGGELYHLKTLTRDAQGRSIASAVDKTVRSFECK